MTFLTTAPLPPYITFDLFQGITFQGTIWTLRMTSVPYVHNIWSLLHWFYYFRPLAAYLCGKLGKCGVNTGSSHDNVKASLEVCHHCPIKNTHRHDMYSFTVSRFPIKTIFLVLTHTKNLLLAVSFIHKRLPLWLALHVRYGRLWQPVPFLTQP